MRRLAGASLLAVALWLAPHGIEAACPPPVAAPTAAEVEEARKKARDRGALWRFEKDGRHGYLYGTLHVGNLEWAIPGRAVTRALRDADTIAIEADIRDAAVRTGMTASPTPQEAYEVPAPLLARLREQAAKLCAPWEQLASYPPMLIVTTLAVIDVRREGLYADYGSELVLAGVAKSAGKTLVSLETVATQRGALVGGAPTEQLAQIEGALHGLETGQIRTTILATAHAWADGDLEAMAQQQAQLPAADRAMVDRVVLSRNPGLAARIEALHLEGRRVFATAGFLHMIGETGLPALLGARGFKVERIPFDR